MAVFIAASDETLGADHRSPFMRCGFLAPVDDWIAITEQWDRRVLAGPPRIPYLHMTDIRSRVWRDEHKLTETDAARRVDEAFAVIAEMPSLTPVGSGLNSGFMYDTITKKMKLTTGAKRKFIPEYIAFPAYVYLVLYFCHLKRPDAEKVDFIVESNGEITDHIREFYAGLPISLEYIGLPQLIPLMGEIIPAGKDRVPLQAADVLCWHTRRCNDGTLDTKGLMQFSDIAHRIGPRFEMPDGYITELWESFQEEPASEEESGVSEVRPSNVDDPSSRPKTVKAVMKADKRENAEKRKTKKSSASGRAASDRD